MSESIEIWEQGFIKNFKFVPYDTQLEANIMGFNNNFQVERLYRRVNKKATKQTHSYYRGVLIPFLLTTEKFRGWLKKDIHNYFKNLFLKDVKELQFGTATVIVVDIESTENISQKKMNQFIDNVRQHLSEKGIQTPEPIKRPL